MTQQSLRPSENHGTYSGAKEDIHVCKFRGKMGIMHCIVSDVVRFHIMAVVTHRAIEIRV